MDEDEAQESSVELKDLSTKELRALQAEARKQDTPEALGLRFEIVKEMLARLLSQSAETESFDSLARLLQ